MATSKHELPKYLPPRPTAWLWKLSLAIIVVAGAFIFILSQKLPDQNATANIRRIIAFTLVAVGICAISATAGRWIKR